ncbi:hypothetical protein EWM64_g10929, partial [Hericium alpestre]
MPTPAEQAEQRKRKRQYDPAYTLVHRSLYRADGIVHLKSYRELPQMKISTEHSMLDLAEVSIPVLRTSHRMPNLAQRSLVRQIRPQYPRDVSSLEEFKSVFIQVVRCHRLGFVKTGGLHGNLSLNKIMFTRDGDGGPLGCLDDWDSAKPIFADEKSTMPAAGSRAGETPFMAIELLREVPPPNLYRHDLESFMYILIWFACHFNLSGSEVLDVSELVADWTYGSWRSIQKSKAFLFSAQSTLKNDILDSITPAFFPINKWIKGLIRMFRASDQARITHEDSLESDAEDEAADAWDEDSLNGTVTYEKFMAAIGEEPHIAELD